MSFTYLLTYCLAISRRNFFPSASSRSGEHFRHASATFAAQWRHRPRLLPARSLDRADRKLPTGRKWRPHDAATASNRRLGYRPTAGGITVAYC